MSFNHGKNKWKTKKNLVIGQMNIKEYNSTGTRYLKIKNENSTISIMFYTCMDVCPDGGRLK